MPKLEVNGDWLVLTFIRYSKMFVSLFCHYS